MKVFSLQCLNVCSDKSLWSTSLQLWSLGLGFSVVVSGQQQLHINLSMFGLQASLTSCLSSWASIATMSWKQLLLDTPMCMRDRFSKHFMATYPTVPSLIGPEARGCVVGIGSAFFGDHLLHRTPPQPQSSQSEDSGINTPYITAYKHPRLGFATCGLSRPAVLPRHADSRASEEETWEAQAARGKSRRCTSTSFQETSLWWWWGMEGLRP